ncbi:hypothetical protein PsYK624_080180 [Phanerochaete sordida]|uniref:NADP-dependent oxidoreductase domain-containing protein n=1 Tax=Phanerochaete sordida TaxID=48140 RepID=A0A9P3G9S1_9APHY|nr:hypothetical protein PsYK624_080180 [Phanerochaete sordida]
MSATRVPLVLGAGSFGTPTSGSRVSDPALVQEFINFCVAHGLRGIDASRIYGNGTAEKLLGSLDLRGFMRVDTKNFPVNPGDHAQGTLKRAVEESCALLGPTKSACSTCTHCKHGGISGDLKCSRTG